MANKDHEIERLRNIVTEKNMEIKRLKHDLFEAAKLNDQLMADPDEEWLDNVCGAVVKEE